MVAQPTTMVFINLDKLTNSELHFVNFTHSVTSNNTNLHLTTDASITTICDFFQ